jgi:hypothetical protein
MNSQEFMSAVWERRNSGADTEEKLVAAILSLITENIKSYTAQNGIQVLDKDQILKLVDELNQ